MGHLIDILESGEFPFLMTEAVELLRAAVGKDYGYDPARPPEGESNRRAIGMWRHWWDEHSDELRWAPEEQIFRSAGGLSDG